MKLLAVILIALATGCVSQSYGLFGSDSDVSQAYGEFGSESGVSQSYWEFGSESIQSVVLFIKIPPGNYDVYECASLRPLGRLIVVLGDTTKTIPFCGSRSRSDKNALLKISGTKAELCLFQERGTCIDDEFCESWSTADDCVAVTPNNAAEDVCGYRTNYDGTVFTLAIGRAFDPNVVFQLCARKEPLDNFVLVRTKSADKESPSDRQLPLDETTYAKLLEIYEQALEYDVKYPMTGADGSSWCLTTQRGATYSSACFWTPTLETDERSLTGLIALGRELWQLADMDLKELY